MKIVYDNIIFSLQRYGGISAVWSNLITRVCKTVSDIIFMEYEGAEDNVCRKDIILPDNTIRKEDARMMKIRRYLNPCTDFVNRSCAGEKFIFHSSYYRTSSHPNAINVTTVHDFAYEFFVKNPIIRHLHSFQKFRAIRKSDKIVCISENTRRDLLKLLPDVDPSRVCVIYNGIDKVFHKQDDAITEDYVLYVGNRDRYKNFASIIRPLTQCGRKLKITGKPLLPDEEKLMCEAHLTYEYCGLVSVTELNHLYNHAFCLIYSSLYEGFGLPVIEAQMAGCPVIALNASSIPEVIGDKRLLVEQFTAASLSEKLTMLEDSDFRTEVIETGLKKANEFSWEKMAQQYLDLYQSLLS